MRSRTQKTEPHAPRRAAPSRRQGETVELEHLIRFLRRYALLVVGVALAAAVGSAAYLVTEKPVYRATAVMAIRTDGVKLPAQSLLMPAQGYLRLLRSRPTLKEARQLLLSRGDEAISAELSLSSVAVRLVRGERWERNTVDLLEIEGLGDTSEVAVKAANAWAEACVLLDEVQTRDAALQEVQTELEDLLGQGEERRLELEGRLAIVSRQLAATPPILTVEATLASPETLVSAAEGRPPARLVSQQPNPLHQQLASQIAEIETSLASAEQRLERLKSDRAFVREKLQERRGRGVEGSREATDTGVEVTEKQALPAELGINVRRALTVPGALRLLQPAVEARRLERGGGKALKVLAAALGGAILGFLAAAGREALRAATSS